jgi:hypothetical protein
LQFSLLQSDCIRFQHFIHSLSTYFHMCVHEYIQCECECVLTFSQFKYNQSLQCCMRRERVDISNQQSTQIASLLSWESVVQLSLSPSLSLSIVFESTFINNIDCNVSWKWREKVNDSYTHIQRNNRILIVIVVVVLIIIITTGRKWVLCCFCCWISLVTCWDFNIIVQLTDYISLRQTSIDWKTTTLYFGLQRTNKLYKSSKIWGVESL